MPDAPIVDTSVEAAPKDYGFSGQTNLLLKSVRASIDGNGAATAFVPALQLLAPDGTVMWSGVSETEVAAGGSADVSWFPGGGLGGGAGAGAAWFFGQRSTNFSVGAGGLGRIPWTTRHDISDPTVFAMHTQINAFDTVNVLKPGICIIQASMGWAPPSNYPHSCGIASGLFTAQGMGPSPVTDSATDVTETTRNRLIADMTIGVTESVPQDIEFVAFNEDAAAHNVVYAFMAIAFLPNSVFAT